MNKLRHALGRSQPPALTSGHGLILPETETKWPPFRRHFQMHFWWTCMNFDWNSLNFVPNIPALVQIMAWRRPGDKPLFEPMLVNLLTHICGTRPQWVKWMRSLINIITYPVTRTITDSSKKIRFCARFSTKLWYSLVKTWPIYTLRNVNSTLFTLWF